MDTNEAQIFASLSEIASTLSTVGALLLWVYAERRDKTMGRARESQLMETLLRMIEKRNETTTKHE